MQGWYQWKRISFTASPNWQRAELVISFNVETIYCNFTPRSRYFNTVAEIIDGGYSALSVTLFDSVNPQITDSTYHSTFLLAMGY